MRTRIALQRSPGRAGDVAAGLEVETSTPQQLAQRIKAETAVWAEVIKSAGIRAE